MIHVPHFNLKGSSIPTVSELLCCSFRSCHARLTDGKCTRHATLATCYKWAQSILKIGFVLANKGGKGEVGGFKHGVPCTWQLLWMAVEKPWLALGWPFLSFMTQMGVDKTPLPL